MVTDVSSQMGVELSGLAGRLEEIANIAEERGTDEKVVEMIEQQANDADELAKELL